jgi:hypothetical protein
LTLTQLINIILDSKMSENSNFIRITYYEIKIKCNLNNEQCDEFIRLAKIKLENMNFKVYLQDEKYSYENASRTVQINEVLIAIRNQNNKQVNKKINIKKDEIIYEKNLFADRSSKIIRYKSYCRQ